MNRKPVKSKGNGSEATTYLELSCGRNHTRDELKRQRKLEKSARKMRDKLKWEYVGCFDESMEGFWWDQSKDFRVEKVHRVNHNVYYDSNSNKSMKKNFAKNGKLARWIKVVPYGVGMHFDAKIHGVAVNAYSEPIIPYKRRNRNDPILSQYIPSDDEGSDPMDNLYGGDDDCFGNAIEKRKVFRRDKQSMKKYHAKLSVDDWDIDGVLRY